MPTASDNSPGSPCVTVVVPAFNAQDTLAQTLASAAAQTHQNLEIVIVDDGSTDDTAAIASRFCAGDARARLVRQANGGVAAARNAGIASARGEWIAPLDADDLWHPEKIARQLGAAAAADAAVAYCWFRDIDEQDAVWRDGPQPEIEGAVWLRMLAHNFVGNGSALLVRRDAALAVGGYDASLHDAGGDPCADIGFQLRLARQFRYAVAPLYLVGYRKRGSAMSADPEAMFRSWQVMHDTLPLSAPMARRAGRWSMAHHRLHLAEGLAWQSRWGAALRQLLQAALRDAVRPPVYLTDLVLRRLRSSGKPARLPRFADLDPALPSDQPERGLPLTRWLERRRNHVLAGLETIPAR